jgi:hypothetical protein
LQGNFSEARRIRARFSSSFRASVGAREGKRHVMSVVRFLGFDTLSCGCVLGRYREIATSREVSYVEEKGTSCRSRGHKRNHTIVPERSVTAVPLIFSKAS